MHFHQRISPLDIETIWKALDLAGHLSGGAKSVIVHDMQRMQQRISMLRQAFPPQSLHALAIKANPVVEILKSAVQAGAGLEAASIEEVTLAMAAGCANEKIVFDSPAKTVDEIRWCLERGIYLNVDNFDELDRVTQILTTLTSNSTVGLRVTPEVGAGSISHTSVGNRGSKFGVSISHDRDRIVAAFKQYPQLVGLHVHVGSQGCLVSQLCDAAAKIDALRDDIQTATGRSISIVDIGGGLPAAYQGDHQPPTPATYASQLRDRVPALFAQNVKLVTEFGRSVQAGCGLAFSRVEYVRQFNDSGIEIAHQQNGDSPQSLAVIHLGADFLVRPVYRPDDWSHEFAVLDSTGRLRRGEELPVSIGGPLCFGGDYPARNVSVPQPQVGDWIAIRDCGAYTLSLWSRHCNRGIPAVVGYDSTTMSARILRPAESPSDVTRFWSNTDTKTADRKPRERAN